MLDHLAQPAAEHQGGYEHPAGNAEEQTSQGDGCTAQRMEEGILHSFPFTPAVSSTDTELYRILRDVTLETFPGAQFVPQVQGGFTDSHFFRDLGIVSYGYEAVATPQADASGVHGNDERVTEQNVRRGVAMTLEIVRRFAASRGVSDE